MAGSEPRGCWNWTLQGKGGKNEKWVNKRKIVDRNVWRTLSNDSGPVLHTLQWLRTSSTYPCLNSKFALTAWMVCRSVKIVMAKVIEVETPDSLKEGDKRSQMSMLVRNYNRRSENPSDWWLCSMRGQRHIYLKNIRHLSEGSSGIIETQTVVDIHCRLQLVVGNVILELGSVGSIEINGFWKYQMLFSHEMQGRNKCYKEQNSSKMATWSSYLRGQVAIMFFLEK